MAILKITKDYLLKYLSKFLFPKYVPAGLYELSEYFRNYGSIEFKFHKEENEYVAVSTNFKYGSIITHGKNQAELDKNVKDAILTSFSIPSSYAKEAYIVRQGAEKYALA